MSNRKIFNDPVHGFMSFDFEILYSIIDHPWFQRLRRISQMGLSHYVYPGAMHTRFQHSLGALFLMKKSLAILTAKGVEITDEEKKAAQIAILLHDVGHGPFSHALEFKLVPISHEEITKKILKKLNVHFDGELDLAIRIFENSYSKKFLHQLVSSQIDVDRLDYLSRDSFYTGVAEGSIGYNRIISMFNVVDQQLVVEEKAIHTLERYLQSRKFMYAQVYLHKTSLAAELMLKSFILRYKELVLQKDKSLEIKKDKISDLNILFSSQKLDKRTFNSYVGLDDTDIITLLKSSLNSSDFILKYLAQSIINRKLLKMRLSEKKIEKSEERLLRKKLAEKFNIPLKLTKFLVFAGQEKVKNYDRNSDEILILEKDGKLTPLSQCSPEFYSKKYFKKHYLCSPII